MRQLLLILSLIGASLCSAAELVDLKQNYVLSLMPLPNSKQAIVGLVDKQGFAGFALCQLEGAAPTNCRMETRFPINNMDSVKAKFEEKLRSSSWNPSSAGFEAGVLAGLGLKTGEIITYYGIKSVISESVILHYGRLFNTELNSPPFVTFDTAGGSVSQERILSALQFAASGVSRKP